METIGQKLSLSLANGRLATKVAIFVTAGDGDHHSFLMFEFSKFSAALYHFLSYNILHFLACSCFLEIYIFFSLRNV